MQDTYYYEYEQDCYYCYPNSFVLKNKLNIIDADELQAAEREVTSLRTAQAMVEKIDGRFDFSHLKKIHRFLFGDIYEWAGKTRTVNISKGNQFCLCEYIQEQMEEVFKKLKGEYYLQNCKSKNEIAQRLAYYLGEINSIHPFREGNGRAQRMFMDHLVASLGYQLDFMKIKNEEMFEASVKTFDLDYRMMEELILRALSNITEN